MGLGEKRRAINESKESREMRDDSSPRWEYLARNLDKVAGMGLENDFNRHGRDGWEFVAVAKGYAVFKRPA
jgi:hypothetical protein